MFSCLAACWLIVGFVLGLTGLLFDLFGCICFGLLFVVLRLFAGFVCLFGLVCGVLVACFI